MPAGRRWGACKFWCLLEHIGKFLVHIQSLGSTFVSMYGFWNIKYLKPFESTEDVVMRCSSLLRQIQVPQCWSFVCMHFRLWFCTWCFRCSFCWRSFESQFRLPTSLHRWQRVSHGDQWLTGTGRVRIQESICDRNDAITCSDWHTCQLFMWLWIVIWLHMSFRFLFKRGLLLQFFHTSFVQPSYLLEELWVESLLLPLLFKILLSFSN